MVWTLGLQTFGHDSAAALLRDGEVIFAIEEERLSRKKHDGSFPRHAISTALDHADIDIVDVDMIAVGIDPHRMIRSRLEYALRHYPEAIRLLVDSFSTIQKMFGHESEIREILGYDGRVVFVPHHLAHLASAWYLCGFEESALMCIDGIGESESLTCGSGNKVGIQIFDEMSVHFPDSLGLLYSAVTDFLGFRPFSDEGKVMGLAAYGDPATFRQLFDSIVTFQSDGRHSLDLEYLFFPYSETRWLKERFLAIAGRSRQPQSPITRRDCDLAAALQEVTERALIHSASALFDRTKLRRLSLAGGVALNCVANGKILRESGFDELFVQPAAHDSGTALGAALQVFYADYPGAQTRKLEHTYFGSSYSDEEVAMAIDGAGMAFRDSDSATREAARHLAAGKVIGWFQGRDEFGPRALGNRSIVAAPFPASMKETLNSKVKHRESFRPFAPVVRQEDLSRYFDHPHPSPFMLITHNVLPLQVEQIPAISHIDGSARVQTIEHSQNASFYDLICEFETLTGVGVLLNTSFNMMGQPIVHTPQQALECFLSTKMDHLVFNSRFIVDAPHC